MRVEPSNLSTPTARSHMNGEHMHTNRHRTPTRTPARSTPRIGTMAMALSIALGGTTMATLSAPAMAQAAQAQQQFSIPAGSLREALNALASQGDITMLYSPELVAEKTTRGLSGRYTANQALERLLQGSGLAAQDAGDSTYTLRQAPVPRATPPSSPRNATTTSRAQAPAVQDLGAVIVTGTRIRGGSTPSPVITIGSERIQEEGFTDLGEVVRSIPQNYSGGQNPGVTSGATGGGVGNQNITGGSGLNLRGLGADATLTLLNGRRMAYGGYVQMVDISAIPVEAVERIEIVADGASAIYGSDAVGGVANVILRRDFDGVKVGALYGTATDDGLTTHEYTATAGHRWATGGFIVTYKNASADPIYSNQRSYTSNMFEPATLYQGKDLSSGLFSINQSIGDSIELRLDALRTEREIFTHLAYSTNYYRGVRETTTFLVSPSIEISLPSDWTLAFGGSWGQDDTDYHQSLITTATGVVSSPSRTCYCNESRAYELGAEGPLFALPGGDARLAVGVGHRTNEFLQRSLITGNTSADGDESSRFAYAEVNLPLIGPEQNVRGARRLMLTGAVRGEDYDSFGSVTTPKLGVIYGPSTDFTLKASWGKSFKAPTLLQRYQAQNSYLYPATMFGGTGYAAGAAGLYLVGGNRNLDPERAKTWSASLAFHPEMLPGFEAELTWFDIDYTDRVAQPIINTQALSNPVFAEFIRYWPTPEEQAAFIAAANTFANFTGGAYDPSNVVAIIPNLYVNTSRQRIHGLDLSGSYRLDLGAGRLTFRGSASWLDSTQQTTSAQSAYDLAGTLFYPAKVNGRLGAVWSQGGFSASVFGNYTSGVTNNLDNEKTASFTTFDTSLRYYTGERNDAFSGLEIQLSAQNMFDRAPPLYNTTSRTNAPYDSTNYSAIGRFVSVSVSKHF